jgi:pimeloyl-ACP methyl ester carboxylesterase
MSHQSDGAQGMLGSGEFGRAASLTARSYPQGDDPELRREYNMIAIDARAHGQSSVETKFGGTFDWRDVGNDTLAVLVRLFPST